LKNYPAVPPTIGQFRVNSVERRRIGPPRLTGSHCGFSEWQADQHAASASVLPQRSKVGLLKRLTVPSQSILSPGIVQLHARPLRERQTIANRRCRIWDTGGKRVATLGNLAYPLLRLQPHKCPSVIIDEFPPTLICWAEPEILSELFAHSVTFPH